ncbi:MAG: hypothetical protein KAS07_01640 [Candidatus Pacebacteria bacterium]|nr:hypothetical protein [Candidatus Paceibacterota bacterium]
MACLLAPAAAAIITTSMGKKVDPKYHIEWLNTMLWGGVIMLMVEHIASGEIVLYPPFLTAMQNPADIPAMLQELATIGGSMTVTIIVTWALMVLITNKAAETNKEKIKITTT